jgi:hypothetical protein
MIVAMIAAAAANERAILTNESFVSGNAEVKRK